MILHGGGRYGAKVMGLVRLKDAGFNIPDTISFPVGFRDERVIASVARSSIYSSGKYIVRSGAEFLMPGVHDSIVCNAESMADAICEVFRSENTKRMSIYKKVMGLTDGQARTGILIQPYIEFDIKGAASAGGPGVIEAVSGGGDLMDGSKPVSIRDSTRENIRGILNAVSGMVPDAKIEFGISGDHIVILQLNGEGIQAMDITEEIATEPST